MPSGRRGENAVLKAPSRRADRERVVTDDTIQPDVVAGLRRRTDALAHRHRRAVAHVALASSPVKRQRLEAMRFELAALEWRLAELERAVCAEP